MAKTYADLLQEVKGAIRQVSLEGLKDRLKTILDPAAPDYAERKQPYLDRLDVELDVIINMGLGVYDRFDALQLEVGAYNKSVGTDAAGAERDAAIQADASEVLPAPDGSPMPTKIDALAGKTSRRIRSWR